MSNEPELLGLSPPDEGESAAQQRQENQAARAFLAAPPGYSFHQLPDGGRIQLLVKIARSHGRAIARLGVGEPTAPTDRAKRAVRDEFLLAGALAVLAALTGGFAVASRVAAPLRRMARVAARVDAGDLGPRMEIAARHDEVRVLAEAFDHMLDRLEDAFDRQTAFVADASHELRTPLTVIRGQLEVLALADQPDAAEVRRVEKLVALEVQRMGRLVEDMLLLAQAGEDGFLRPGVIQLRPFLTDLVRGMADAGPRRLELGAIPELLIEADEGRLAQALRNLLRNAIAHTAENGLVELSVQADGGRLRFVVDDDGPGIPVRAARRDLRPLPSPRRRPLARCRRGRPGPRDRLRDRLGPRRPRLGRGGAGGGRAHGARDPAAAQPGPRLRAFSSPDRHGRPALGGGPRA